MFSHILLFIIAKFAVSDITGAMISDRINETTNSIPVYLPITVQVAMGMIDDSSDAFNGWMKSVAKLVEDMTVSYVFYEGSYNCSHYLKSFAKNLS
jgi:hypothetical protein